MSAIYHHHDNCVCTVCVYNPDDPIDWRECTCDQCDPERKFYYAFADAKGIDKNLIERHKELCTCTDFYFGGFTDFCQICRDHEFDGPIGNCTCPICDQDAFDELMAERENFHPYGAELARIESAAGLFWTIRKDPEGLMTVHSDQENPGFIIPVINLEDAQWAADENDGSPTRRPITIDHKLLKELGCKCGKLHIRILQFDDYQYMYEESLDGHEYPPIETESLEQAVILADKRIEDHYMYCWLGYIDLDFEDEEFSRIIENDVVKYE